MAVGQDPNDALGIVISYSVSVSLNCGAIGGELLADLPFKLVHPSPGVLSYNHNRDVIKKWRVGSIQMDRQIPELMHELVFYNFPSERQEWYMLKKTSKKYSSDDYVAAFA